MAVTVTLRQLTLFTDGCSFRIAIEADLEGFSPGRGAAHGGLWKASELFPTTSSMIIDGAGLVEFWLDNAMSSIDFSERPHAAFRKEAKSSRRGKSQTAVSNIVAVRESHSHHVANGGVPAVTANVINGSSENP